MEAGLMSMPRGRPSLKRAKMICFFDALRMHSVRECVCVVCVCVVCVCVCVHACVCLRERASVS